MDDFEQWTATKIQSSFRGFKIKKEFDTKKKSALVIQREWRAHQRAVKNQITPDDAVSRIQRLWRRYSSVRIYRYYRDMIRFRERGDPALLLRTINPKEIEYMDPAMGAHLRFRLGGITFPPIIYYKVFTHRPVTDINSFAPRDYTSEVTLGPRNKHSHPIPGVEELLNDTSGWYQRVENNGWRPISERILLDVDPITQFTSAKRRPFHYNPVVRKEDAERKRKARQREWMQKLYRDGRVSDKAEELMASGVEPAVNGSLRQLLEDDDADPEMAELLKWTSALDFDAYQRDWHSLATSEWAENTIPLPSDYWEPDDMFYAGELYGNSDMATYDTMPPEGADATIAIPTA